MKKKFLFFTIAFLILATTSTAQVTDKDGNVYKTVKIGTQVWMAENLNVSHFRNGDPIPEVEDAGAWAQAGKDGKPAWCYYDSNPANGRTYHKLYNWYAVNDPRDLAPYGWHVPSWSEWLDLYNKYFSDNNYKMWGAKMKATYGWLNKGNGTNESGFAALPGGARDGGGAFDKVGRFGGWWSSSSSEGYDIQGYCLPLYGNYDGFASDSSSVNFKGDGFSVRCVKDTAQKKMISDNTIISDSSKSESGHLINNTSDKINNNTSDKINNNTSDKINKVIDNVLNGKIFKKKNKAPKQ